MKIAIHAILIYAVQEMDEIVVLTQRQPAEWVSDRKLIPTLSTTLMKTIYLSLASSHLRFQVMKEYRQRLAARYPVRSLATRIMNAVLRQLFAKS